MKATQELEQCQMRSETDHPCSHPAVMKIKGVPFCEPCAREQEAYFAIGELTKDPRLLRDESLMGMLERTRRIGQRRCVVDDHEPDAA